MAYLMDIEVNEKAYLVDFTSHEDFEDLLSKVSLEDEEISIFLITNDAIERLGIDIDVDIDIDNDYNDFDEDIESIDDFNDGDNFNAFIDMVDLIERGNVSLEGNVYVIR